MSSLSPVYVLHCPELADRSEACARHLAERKIPATFFRSFHGFTWGLDTTLEYDAGKRISPGHVGLNLGFWALCQHLLLEERSYRLGSDPDLDGEYIIFEDDVRLCDGFVREFGKLRRELDRDQPDWQLVFLGLAEVEPHVWNKVTERVGGPDSRLCRLNDPFGTHALLVRGSALPVLVEHMRAAHRNLDQQLWERVLKPGRLKWCACFPPLVEQRTFDHARTGTPEWAPSTINARPREVPGVPATDRSAAVALVRPPAPDPVDPTYEPPSPKVVATTSALVDPYPCIYAGEPLESDGFDERERSVPLTQCGRLNVPCHNRDVKVFREGAGDEAVLVKDCKSCDLRTSMASTTVRERLPLPEGHFNPSMLEYGGRLILATRDSWGHSKVALWALHNEKPDWTGKWSVEPIGSYASPHPAAPRLEDPRLFLAPRPDDRNGPHYLHAMFNLPDGYPPKRVQVGYVRFDAELTKIEHTEVFRSPHNNLYEKNWVPFHHHRNGLSWVYASKPDHVVIGDSSWSTSNPLPWTGGVVRGGACPVLCCDGQPGKDGSYGKDRMAYYHFFHGCLKRLKGNVYTVGCCVFEADPPFKILRQTATPLVWPDLPGPGEDVVKRYVVWPGGAVAHAGAWHLAVGVDDTFCRIVRLPFDTVEAALTDVPETQAVTSIRGTPVDRGFRDPNRE